MKKLLSILFLILFCFGVYAKDEKEKKGYIIYKKEKLEGIMSTDTTLPVGYDSASQLRIEELPINNTNTYRENFFQLIYKGVMRDVDINKVSIFYNDPNKELLYETLYYETVYNMVTLDETTNIISYETVTTEIRKQVYRK